MWPSQSVFNVPGFSPVLAAQQAQWWYQQAQALQQQQAAAAAAASNLPLALVSKMSKAESPKQESFEDASPIKYSSPVKDPSPIKESIYNKSHKSTKKMPRVAKGDAKPRGRMTAYAYFVQICREEHKKKHPEENVVFAEFSKKCAERWKTMSDKEKSRFHEMADKDKKRYDHEMLSYTPSKGEKVRGKKRKHMKDPNAPKRSLSAFFMFCKDERPKVKAAHPEYGVGDIAKELGKRWAEVDGPTKAKFEAQAEKDKARYDKEMTEYKKKSKFGAPTSTPAKGESEEDEEDEEEEEDE